MNRINKLETSESNSRVILWIIGDAILTTSSYTATKDDILIVASDSSYKQAFGTNYSIDCSITSNLSVSTYSCMT